MAVLLKKNQEPLPRPRQFVPSLPDSVENVLIKALAKDPQNRYQTAQELVNAFERILSGQTETVAVPPAGKNVIWVWIAISAIIGILICGIIGIAILKFAIPTKEQPSPQPMETSAFLPSPTTFQENTATSTLEILSPTSTLPATSIPTPIPTEEPPPVSNPEDFARWYFTSLWTERDYEYLWNNCQTESFQNHASGGDFNDYVKWWSSVKQVEIHSIDVTDNNGSYASINVELSFILNSGRTVAKDTYGYDLIYNIDTKTWMFDYRK
jgi:serine/threonine protein kinase